jgi:exodeoxyribonuclease X
MGETMRAAIADTETTGINEPALVEVAYAPVTHDGQHFQMGHIHLHRLNPGKPIELDATATHHIFDEDVRDCDAAADFKFPEVEYIIGHNIDFDANALKLPATVKRICTLAMAKRQWPHLGRHTLTTCVYAVKGRTPETREALRQAHSAAADVAFCRDVLAELLIEACNPDGTPITTLEQLHAHSEYCRMPTHMTFGKYKGRAVGDVPYDYRSWYLRQNDPPPDPWLVKAWELADEQRRKK